MTGNAYRCDGCDEYFDGDAEFTMDVQIGTPGEGRLSIRDDRGYFCSAECLDSVSLEKLSGAIAQAVGEEAREVDDE